MIQNKILVSQVSLFEIAIKLKIGKLRDFKSSIKDIFDKVIKDNIIFLPVLNEHLYSYDMVHFRGDHRDPFDRLLIATALEESAVMLTTDKSFSLYTDLIQVAW